MFFCEKSIKIVMIVKLQFIFQLFLTRSPAGRIMLLNKSPGAILLKRLFPGLALVASSALYYPPPALGQDQPTIISNVKVEPSPFSPNNDGINETTKFSFTLSEESTVSVEILFFSDSVYNDTMTIFYGELNDTLRLGDQKLAFASDTIFLTSQGIAGVNEFIWGGKVMYKVTKQMILLPDSSYTFLIRAEDKDTDDQYRTRPVTGKVKIDSWPPEISSVSVNPNPFSPNNDGSNDVTRISFNLSGLPQNASIGTLAFEVALVGADQTPTFQMDQTNTTPSNFYTGVPLDVPYAPIALQFIKRTKNTNTITIQLRGGRILESADTITVFTQEIVIDPTDPVGKVYKDETLFSFIDNVLYNGPTDPIEKNQVEVRTSAGGVKVDVFDNTNKLVASNLTLDPPFSGDGSYAAVFGPGPYVDGVYNYIITAVDESGNLADPRSGTVTARSNPLSITDFEVRPNTISPADKNNKFDFCTISYRLTQPGNVTIQVFRDSTIFVPNNLVRTLIKETPREAKGYTTTWDGKNDGGVYVTQNAERSYRIIVSAYDPVTRETSEARSLVLVDNLPPTEMHLDPLPSRTKTATATVSGRTDPGDSVYLFLNGLQLTPPEVDINFGLFESAVSLSEELNRINAQAFDAVKNGPTNSDTLRVVLDTRPPTVIDTLIYVAGVPQKLKVAVLTGLSPADTIELRLSDGTGRVSGVNLSLTTIRISSPSGADLEGNVLTRPPDKVRFVPAGETTQQGTYNLRSTFSDSLENRDSVKVSFDIGAASTGPALVNVNVNPSFGGFLNSSQGQGQAWAFTVNVADNSGTGINPDASSLELFFLPSGQKIAGDFSVQGTRLTFTVTQSIANDGSKDGEFELRIKVEDNDPASGTLSTAVRYLNDTRPPDTLSVTADSARFAVTLKDLSPGSGINLDSCRMTVTPVAADRVIYSNDGDSTLFAVFDPPLRESGTYTMTITIRDKAGNQSTRKKVFSIGVGFRVLGVVPADGAILSRSLAEGRRVATITLQDLSGTGIDSAATSIRLIGPAGDSLPGTTEILSTGAVNFVLDDLLPVDGSADGRYRIELKADDKSPQTAPLEQSFTFLFDTRAPDTVAAVLYGQGRVDSAAALVSDTVSAAGRETSGFNFQSDSTFIRLLSPAGQPLSGDLQRTSRGKLFRLTLIFDPPPAEPGIYTLEVGMVDFAGNARTRQAFFTVGSPEIIPGIIQVSSPFGTAVYSGRLNQPIQPAVHVQDNSGTGIDWEKSYLKLLGPDSVEIPGQLSHEQDALMLAVSKLLSNSGSDDGLYILETHIEDLSPATGNLDTTFSFILDNLAPDTAGIAFAPDTSWISIILQDKPAVAGRMSSGVEILYAGATVISPTGATVARELIHDGVSTLTLRFTEGKPAEAGMYVITITVSDKAGNQRTRNISFPLGVSGTVLLFPPDSAVVRGPLSGVTAVVKGAADPLVPGSGALIRVTRRGLPVEGLSGIRGDTVVFAFSNVLATDGSADGRYDVTVELDLTALGLESTKKTIFTVDNIPPDTARIEITLSASGLTVVAELTDGGSYPDVGGIDQGSTALVIEDPAGRVIEPNKVMWLDKNTLEAQFQPLGAAGLHRLRLEITDRAGLVTTRRVPVINTFGLAEGKSVAFVEEVPARTQASLVFVSGHSDRRITRALLRIFNLRGDLICRLDVTDRIDPSGSLVNAEWLLQNDRGALVTNGVFIYSWEVVFDDGRTERIRKTLAVAHR